MNLFQMIAETRLKLIQGLVGWVPWVKELVEDAVHRAFMRGVETGRNQRKVEELRRGAVTASWDSFADHAAFCRRAEKLAHVLFALDIQLHQVQALVAAPDALEAYVRLVKNTPLPGDVWEISIGDGRRAECWVRDLRRRDCDCGSHKFHVTLEAERGPDIGLLDDLRIDPRAEPKLIAGVEDRRGL